MQITAKTFNLNLGFGDELYSVDCHKNYREFQIIGEKYDLHPVKNPQPAFGIGDYIDGTSVFTGRGLIDMPWVPANMASMQEVCDRIKEILIEGG